MRQFFNTWSITGIISVLIMLINCCDLCRADIYMYKDENGVVHLGNGTKARQKGDLFMKETPRYNFNLSKDKQKIIKLIEEAAVKHKVDPDLAMAVARAESSFRTDAVSPKGAIGVMQLMPDTAKRMKVKDIYHPKQNIEGGVRYLRLLLDMFPKDIKLAIAAYNAGENRVKRAGNTIPNIRETQQYVDRVIRYYNALKDNKSAEQKTKTDSSIGRPVKKKINSDGVIVLSNL